ncbi:MAG TPA: cobalamin-binding protein [Deltaproteobacteria bacterium]|nr:cobalamin-binding protein [Deltaproteobacteria bacterium]
MKQAFKNTVAAFLLALVAFFTAFSPAISPAREVTDETGRKVRIAPFPQRIVSLAPGITETLYALELEDNIAGVTTFCDWPKHAKDKEKVGGFTNPSIEKIVSLNPDLILATADGNRKDTVYKLERLGLPVYVINPSDSRGIMESILRIGEITDRRQQADALTTDLQKRLNYIAGQTKSKNKPRVFFQLGLEPVISAGAGTLINEAIEMAGGVNIARLSATRYPRYSAEGIMAGKPDIILFAPMTGNKELAAVKNLWKKIDEIPAIKNGRIYPIDIDLISRASPRIVDAIEQMALIFHPEIKIGK